MRCTSTIIKRLELRWIRTWPCWNGPWWWTDCSCLTRWKWKWQSREVFQSNIFCRHFINIHQSIFESKVWYWPALELHWVVKVRLDCVGVVRAQDRPAGITLRWKEDWHCNVLAVKWDGRFPTARCRRALKVCIWAVGRCRRVVGHGCRSVRRYVMLMRW